MKPQDQIADVAELNGEKLTRKCSNCNGAGAVNDYGQWIPCDHCDESGYVDLREEEFDDYLGSRDAIIAVIEKQPNDIQYAVSNWLKNNLAKERPALETSPSLLILAALKATASQLTEALLRATGKWKE